MEKNKILIIIVIFILLALGIIGITYFITHKNENKEELEKSNETTTVLENTISSITSDTNIAVNETDDNVIEEKEEKTITVLNQLLKRILQRPRPTEFRIIEETGYSFPSGHSMVSMAFYGYLIYLIYKYVKNKYVKWILIALLSILICTIGVSRIYLGVHYTSDVLGGFLVSISYLILFISTVNKFFIEKD